MDYMEKLNVLVQDVAFAEALSEMENAESVQKALAEKGVDLTLEQIAQWGEAIRKSHTEGELSEDDLEDVAGGAIIWRPRWPKLPKPRPRPLPMPLPRWPLW